MTRIILDIFRYLQRHRSVAWLLFAGITAYMLVSMLSIVYKEDIRDFLPFDDDNATAMEIYQDITGANRIYAVVSGNDTDSIIAGVEVLLDNISRKDSLGYVARTVAAVDEDAARRVTGAVYSLMPVLLNDSDYDRIDSILSSPGVVDSRLGAVKEILQMPTSGMVVDNLKHDPLGLFATVMSRLQSESPAEINTVDGYIMSADGTDAFVLLESAFGANESGLNGLLADMLDEAAAETVAICPDIEITFTGGPIIAVENARCIRHDSLWSIIAAGIVIMALLVYVFRSARNIALIFVSVGWGWLFAMGAIALYYDSVSIIVIGIASVMLGIAVNYPLHLVDHLGECRDRKAALAQIVAPLVVGNVTTVGAFLCLVPLDSPALHDLGLFSSMLLIGTILFVLIFLPHIVKVGRDRGENLIDRVASVDVPQSPVILWFIVLLTAVFAVFSLKTTFDPDLRKINYLTDSNKELLDRLGRMFDTRGGGMVYVASSGSTWDDAVQQFERTKQMIDGGDKGLLGDFIVSRERQLERLGRWRQVADRRDSISVLIDAAAQQHGFAPGAFIAFYEILDRDYGTVGEEELSPLLETLFARSISIASGRYSIVEAKALPCEGSSLYVSDLRNSAPAGTIVFDVESMNGALTGVLADDFNYIGFACGCIVFLFLWLSMGRVELAVVSFLPMAVSWIWILGIMGMLDLHFNIVNVILATFIFGQGDDYTIFITEGLSYEYAYGKKVVARYKSSIVVSALIMFAGIGVLAFARHPAMRSLGQVAVIGMIVVVVMAYVIPPLAFGFLVRHKGQLRYRPLTARKLWLNLVWWLKRKTGIGVTAIPGVSVKVEGARMPGRPKVVVAYNHRSPLDRWLIGSLADSFDIVDTCAVEVEDDLRQGERAAQCHGAELLNVCIVGADMLLPLGENFYSPGNVTVLLNKSPLEYDGVWRDYVTLDDICAVIADRYLYKGVEIRRKAMQDICKIKCCDISVYKHDPDTRIEFQDPGQGELTLVYSMLNPQGHIYPRYLDREHYDLAVNACHGLPPNVNRMHIGMC